MESGSTSVSAAWVVFSCNHANIAVSLQSRHEGFLQGLVQSAMHTQNLWRPGCIISLLHLKGLHGTTTRTSQCQASLLSIYPTGQYVNVVTRNRLDCFWATRNRLHVPKKDYSFPQPVPPQPANLSPDHQHCHASAPVTIPSCRLTFKGRR